MSLFDSKPHVVTAQDLLVFKQVKRHFACGVCGKFFAIGDTCRFVLCNHISTIKCHNFHVCDKCDGPDVLEKADATYQKAKLLAQAWNIYGPDWNA